jgi:hypothetical protein
MPKLWALLMCFITYGANLLYKWVKIFPLKKVQTISLCLPLPAHCHPYGLNWSFKTMLCNPQQSCENLCFKGTETEGH